jgi:uncharacterized protein YlxW (UPF0749 family)
MERDNLSHLLAQASGAGPWTALFLLAAVTAYLLFVTLKFQSKWNALLRTGSSESLDEQLDKHLRERAQLSAELEALHDKVLTLERKLERSKRHIGLVNYDAFGDSTGNLSFAVAIYDDNGDGIVLNALTGRDGSRTYAKPLLRGKSEKTLTNEEQEAILAAVRTGPKTMVSS